MSTDINPEAESSQQIRKGEAYEEARHLMRVRRHGVLATLSKKEAGWPFGSVVPYGLSPRGEPIVYMAQIAEHHRNISADDRVSLLVYDGAEVAGQDVQEKGRLTVLARARRARPDEADDLWARYRARLPQASGYSLTHGFELFVLEVTRLRYIGGFGKIFWLDVDPFLLDPQADPLVEVAPMVIKHMNDDHQDALTTYSQAFAGLTPKSVTLVGVDAFGLDVQAKAPDLRLRFEFSTPATPATIRQATIQLLAEARAALQSP